MPNTITRKNKTKLVYTPSALPLILEALGYENCGNKLVHLSDGSYVYDDKGKKINVSEIVGFEKGRIYIQKNVFKKIETRKVK